MSGLLVPSNYGNGKGHLVWNVYASCEKCHTCYTKYERSSIYLGHSLYAQS